MEFEAAILCGGSNRRMGTDKALISIDGRSMVGRISDALDNAGAGRVLAVGGDSAGLAAEGLSTADDRWPGQGPLGGIVTALGAARADAVLVVSCDLVHPDPAAMRLVVGRLLESGADVAVPVHGDREQWLHAGWRRRTCALLESVFDAGERSVVGGCLGLRVERLLDVPGEALQDADRPSDLPPGAMATFTAMDIPTIDIDTLHARIDAGAPVFDVRQPDEYEEAHVPGVVLVPLGDVADRVGEFPTDGTVYVICKSGGRSAKAVEFLRGQGVDAVNVAGGTMAWIEAGHTTERGN